MEINKNTRFFSLSFEEGRNDKRLYRSNLAISTLLSSLGLSEWCSSLVSKININQASNLGFRLVSMLVIYTFLSFSSIAQSPTQLLATANDAYKAKNYELATQGYEKLLSQGYKTADLYYNLGCCYYKSNQLGRALVQYERAARLAPSDEDIKYNLKLANQKTIDKLQPVPQLAIITGWQQLVHSRSATSWAIYSLVAVWLALMGFALYLFVVGIKRLSFYTGIIGILAVILLSHIAYQQHDYETGATQAILTTTMTTIKSAPDATSVDLYTIHEGAKLNILDKVGDWNKVRLADGKVGWLQQTGLEVI